MSEVKSLQDLNFTKFADLSKEEFDEILANDHSTIGFLSGLRGLVSQEYFRLIEVARELYKKAETTEGEESKESKETADNLKAVLILLEYKVTAIVQKINALTELESSNEEV